MRLLALILSSLLVLSTAAATPARAGGRCTGSASCAACKNCSECRHCAKDGGTCGVCSAAARPAAPAQDALHAIYAAASGSGVAVPEWADEAQKLRDEAAELERQIRRRLEADEP